MATLTDKALRWAATAAHAALKAVWFVRRPKTFGAHAYALTPDSKLVLVKLRYAPGWRLPGGGRAESENPKAAALRELREEIGMISHGDARLACELQEPTDFKRDTAALVVVRDVRYRPKKWNWEIEQVREVDPERLPPDLSPLTARWINAIRPLL